MNAGCVVPGHLLLPNGVSRILRFLIQTAAACEINHEIAASPLNSVGALMSPTRIDDSTLTDSSPWTPISREAQNLHLSNVHPYRLAPSKFAPLKFPRMNNDNCRSALASNEPIKFTSVAAIRFIEACSNEASSKIQPSMLDFERFAVAIFAPINVDPCNSA